MRLDVQRIRSLGNRGEPGEGKVKLCRVLDAMKHGWRDLSPKAWGEVTCLHRHPRERTWSWRGNVSRPIAAVPGWMG